MKKLLAIIGLAGLLSFGVAFAAQLQPATVSSITPTSGTVAGGTSVTISGNHFKSGQTVVVSSVTIGGVSVPFTVTNNSTLVATTSVHSAGAVNIVVTNADGSGTLTNGFTYVADPTITSSVGAGGTISPNGATSVSYNTNKTFTITPSANYHISNVTVDGSSVGATTSYQFSNVTTNHTISATFAIDTYTLTYTAGAHGSITGSSPQTVGYGSSGTAVTAVPASGFQFLNWSDASTNNPRTDSFVTGNVSVTANFKDTQAPVITLLGSATVNLNVGDTYTDAGATALDNLDGDITGNIITVGASVNTSVEGTSTVHYNVIDLAGNTAVEVTRTVVVSAVPVVTHTISVSAPLDGSISPAGPSVTVNDGSNQSFTITANSGYHVSDVTVDGSSVGATSTYLFSGVTSDHTIAATFAADPVPEPCNGSTFDSFSNGSVNGQGGWTVTSPFDQAVTNNTYGYTTLGCKVLRFSDGQTSGEFGTQLLTPSTANEAGETTALNNGLSGGTRKSHFEAQFDLASTMSTEQTGMHFSVSPIQGGEARMAYLRFEDSSDGIHVIFDDVQGIVSGSANFVDTQIATLDRSTPHTIKFVMDFVSGPSNDIVKIYIDGALVHTGTSWEDYYWFDPEWSVWQTMTVDSLLFRESGTATPANAGNGFLLDNVAISTDNTPLITLNGSGELRLTQNYDYTDPMATATNAIDGSLAVSADVPLTTGTIGTYTITYTATSTDNIAASVTRIVHIVPQSGGAGGTNGVPGCKDPSATNYDPNAVFSGQCSYAGQVLGAASSTDGTPVGAGNATSTTVTASSTGIGQVLGATAYGFTRDLRLGSRGEDVGELQKILIAGGYLKITLPTNYFGMLTRSAVAAWQKANGISPAAGYFGSLSRAFLAK